MAIIATVKQTSRILVANVTSLTSPPTTPALELKNNPAALKINNMASLSDVDTAPPVNGGVLVYNSTTNIYKLEAIDDGTF
jgi:hypothetical protein